MCTVCFFSTFKSRCRILSCLETTSETAWECGCPTIPLTCVVVVGEHWRFDFLAGIFKTKNCDFEVSVIEERALV